MHETRRCIIRSMIEPKTEKINEDEFRLTYDLAETKLVEYPAMGTRFVYGDTEYQIKEVVASNSDSFTFDVTVR